MRNETQDTEATPPIALAIFWALVVFWGAAFLTVVDAWDLVPDMLADCVVIAFSAGGFSLLFLLVFLPRLLSGWKQNE